MNNEPEKALVIKAKKQDLSAFEELYRIYYERIYRYLFFKSGSREAAEDLCQLTFMGAFQNIGSFDLRGDNFTGWLFRIAHNKCMSHFRKIYHSKEDLVPSLENTVENANPTDPTSLIANKEILTRVRKAIQHLNPKQKEVIELRFISGLSIKETASAIGKSCGAVKLLQFRALKKLKDILAYEGKKAG